VKKRVWEIKIRQTNHPNPPLNESNPENTRKPPPPTIQTKQWQFSSHSVPKQHQNKPEKPAKQQNNRENNPKPPTTKNTPKKPL